MDNVVHRARQSSSTRTSQSESIAGQAGTASHVKHRSSQACQSCRARKVRCDVSKSESNCTNCRLDGLTCVVVPSRRGKGNRKRQSGTVNKTSSQASQSSAPGLNFRARTTSQDDDRDSHGHISARSAPDVSAQVPVCVTFDEDVESMAGDQQTRDVSGSSPNIVSIDAYNGLPTPDTGPNAIRPCQNTTGKIVLPEFIAPLSSRITQEDIDFLVQKGATLVPEPELQIEILRGYLFSVHPFMPMLDYRPFIGAVSGSQSHHQISLLLFQAVMFAGLHSLPLHVIHSLGFDSTKEARKVYFNRVRLLYEFDVESDDAAVLQSLILMSSWYDTWQDRRHTWHWTGLAFDLARNMGLHREPTSRHASDRIRHFRRRLWWSLYIRDRMIALGTRRPLRIRDDDFNVALLTLEDFDLEYEDETYQVLPLQPNAEENTATALMCIQLAKLCVCIGHVTTSQYTTLSQNPDVPHTMMIVSRQDGNHVAELDRCDKELDEWFQALETNVKSNATSAQSKGRHSCSEVHGAMLKIAYLTTVNVLHRTRALQPLANAADAQIAKKSSRAKVKDSARRITQESQTMLVQDQARYFGLLGVTALIAASLSHLLDITSGDDDVRDASTFRLFQSVEVLQYLRAIYASADAAVSFLESITRRAGLALPVPRSLWNHSGGQPEHELVSLPSAPNPDQPLGQPSPFRGGFQPEQSHEKLGGTAPSDTFLHADASLGTQVWPGVSADTSFRGPTSTLQASDTSPHLSTTGQSNPYLMNVPPGEFANIAAEGLASSWIDGMEASMGLFNYDFYSNAFGMSDGPFDGT